MSVSFCCPRCRGPLEPLSPDVIRCPADGIEFSRGEDDVWCFLSAAERRELQGFMTSYATVREAEGWGERSSEYYRALPFRDLSGRHPEIWRIRAISYRTLMDRVVNPLARPGRRLRIADLGAGNGWLSYRLALAGHDAVAVDVFIDALDGLGACRHYPVDFQRVEATFDRLPWPDGTFDLVLFNGSLHYSRDYGVTLFEARRHLGAGGRLVVLDTPIYEKTASGEAMVCERRASFRQRYGIVDDIRHESYLTPQRLDVLAEEIGLHWTVMEPHYGWRWMLRPCWYRLRGRREPMRFKLLVGGPRR